MCVWGGGGGGGGEPWSPGSTWTTCHHYQQFIGVYYCMDGYYFHYSHKSLSIRKIKNPTQNVPKVFCMILHIKVYGTMIVCH